MAEKETKKLRLSIPLTESMAKRVKAIARSQDRSMAMVVSRILAEQIDHAEV